MGIAEYNNKNIQENNQYQEIIFLNVTKESYKKEQNTAATENKKTNYSTNDVELPSKKTQIQEFNEIKNQTQEKNLEDSEAIFDISISNLNKNSSYKKSQEQNELYNVMEKMEEIKQNEDTISLKEDEEEEKEDKIEPKKQNNGVIHTKNDGDNARKKVYGSCMQSTWDSLGEIGQRKGINFTLNKPFIKSQIKSSFTDNKKFFNKSLYYIFIASIPRNVGKQYQNDRSQYSIINRNTIDNFLLQEINNPYADIKLLNKLLKLPFLDYLIPYLNDETTVIIQDEFYGKIEIDLPGFKTYKDCFNDEYNDEQKNLFKEHIFSIIKGEVKNRKPRRKNI